MISLSFVKSEFFSGFFYILIQTYRIDKNPVALLRINNSYIIVYYNDYTIYLTSPTITIQKQNELKTDAQTPNCRNLIDKKNFN